MTQRTPVEFDGEVPVDVNRVREFINEMLPVEQFGYTSRVTFIPGGNMVDGLPVGPYIEVDYLGDTMDDIRIDMDAMEAITEVRRYKVPVPDEHLTFKDDPIA